MHEEVEANAALVPLTLVAGLGHWMLGSIDCHLLGALLAGSSPGIVIGSHVSVRGTRRGPAFHTGDNNTNSLRANLRQHGREFSGSLPRAPARNWQGIAVFWRPHGAIKKFSARSQNVNELVSQELSNPQRAELRRNKEFIAQTS